MGGVVDWEIENPPFAVYFPGQRRHSKDAPYNFRHSVDPRLGSAQRLIKSGFLTDPDKLSLDPEPTPPPPPPPCLPEKRKPADKCEDSKPAPPRKFTLTTIGKVMPKEEADQWRARARKKYSSKEYRLERIQRYKQSIKDWIDYEEQNYRVRDIRSAKAAVEFYNKKHGTDYEIVEALGCCSKLYNGFLHHCNFRAQRKCETNSGSRRSPKLFFAELFNDLTPEAVKLCVILDNAGPCRSLPQGCKICPGLLSHPVDFVICSWLQK